ncbi:hypothetical protein M8C21_005303 [Ambrosia artemisiifolia]|uniref:Uncharacterized protein n=1 Tax=Ambrosia artemisiifolia TaxID=4212 RepID=A0AAD5BSX1_AMBAR|nr:hypothetical protein M8C21_005303 [Ambrosia artemisiifolia]
MVQRFDLITTLPQAIIETILCLLPIEEAARTSILSKEWRNHTLKKLRFNFNDQSSYGLPLSFFTSFPQLTDLDLEHCVINHKPIFNGFGSLTRLSLSNISISKETLLHLLSNCPSLKSLCLLLFEEDFLSDGKPSIMELCKCLPVIEHLTTLGHIIRLKRLVQASVSKELPTSLIHLKYVCIEQMCFVDGYGLPFLAVLTKCCPNLEKIKLVIDTDWNNENEKVSAVLEEYSDVWLEHMKVLEIDFFRNFRPELEFVKFILARSPSLRKVILLTCMVDKNTDLEILRSLLNAPCSSPVKIVVRNRCE